MTADFEIVAFAISAFIAIAGALGMATTMSMFRSGIFLMASFIGVAGLFILLAADLIGVLQIMMYIGGFLVMILFMVLVMHDPGGAMMAGMDMVFIERWFSKGLAPREPSHGDDGNHLHGEDSQARGAQQQFEDSAERHGTVNTPRGHGTNDDGHADTGHQAMQHINHGDDEKHAIHHDDGKNGGMLEMSMSMVTPVRPVAAWLAFAVGAVLVGMLILHPAWHVISATPDPDSARRIGHLLMEKYMVAFEGAGFLILIGIFGAVLLARPSTYPDDPARNARVAVDEKPEPIANDGLTPLVESGGRAGHHEAHQRFKERSG